MQLNGGNQMVNQMLGQINNNNQKKQNSIIPVLDFSKEQLWVKFIDTFYEMFGQKFISNVETIHNIKVLFFYFLRDAEFFKCKNLRGDISKPSFQKGLLIIGGYGLGKTDYFKAFEKVFEKIDNYRFKFYNSKELVAKYELCQTSFDKSFFYKDIERKKIFIDDLNSERVANNYGKMDLIEEVLSIRYNKKRKTFASCNYSNTNECAVKTLENLGIRYGARIYDRFYEMFNIIEFKGKSFRR